MEITIEINRASTFLRIMDNNTVNTILRREIVAKLTRILVKEISGIGFDIIPLLCGGWQLLKI